jgi:hypothetical protein
MKHLPEWLLNLIFFIACLVIFALIFMWNIPQKTAAKLSYVIKVVWTVIP